MSTGSSGRLARTTGGAYSVATEVAERKRVTARTGTAGQAVRSLIIIAIA